VEITFLGTSSGVPTKSRNVSSIALRHTQRGEIWLFDCGEGTQHQILRSELKTSQLKKIFITHMHGDHIFGLMGLLASCGLGADAQNIEVYGPPGIEPYLKACMKYSHTYFPYGVSINTVREGVIYEDEEFIITVLPLKHRITAFGYRVAEKNRPGKFDVEKAKKLGIPFGPVYGKLKAGETITLEDGRTFVGSDFCGPTEIGRKFVYCTDTVFCENAITLAEDADVLVHEATFAHQDAQMAFEKMHSTTTMAAQVALAAQVKKLIMTHFSPRYNFGNSINMKDLLKEAQAIFSETAIAYDFYTYAIPRRR
jgi:ribonuclease Z